MRSPPPFSLNERSLFLEVSETSSVLFLPGVRFIDEVIPQDDNDVCVQGRVEISQRDQEFYIPERLLGDALFAILSPEFLQHTHASMRRS